MRLEDRVVIVTGAGQGVGKTYAERLSADGASIIVALVNSPGEVAARMKNDSRWLKKIISATGIKAD
jgi:NAD(P)-dependent dehydrogenase (short-subunit alcohol dehydrogenase family)